MNPFYSDQMGWFCYYWIHVLWPVSSGHDKGLMKGSGRMLLAVCHVLVIAVKLMMTGTSCDLNSDPANLIQLFVSFCACSDTFILELMIV